MVIKILLMLAFGGFAVYETVSIIKEIRKRKNLKVENKPPNKI